MSTTGLAAMSPPPATASTTSSESSVSTAVDGAVSTGVDQPQAKAVVADNQILPTTGVPGNAQTQSVETTTALARQPVQANPVDQIKVQLGKSLKDGSDTLSIQLHPDDLGRVDIKLQMQDGQVKATITADRPETLQLLKNDASVLQQSLNSAGLNTDSNSLNFQMREDLQQQQQQQRQTTQNENNGAFSDQATTSDDDSADSLPASIAAFTGSAGSNQGLDINV
jgi:flagellar hook-length control protein FliK